jgi:hypothetical protein
LTAKSGAVSKKAARAGYLLSVKAANSPLSLSKTLKFHKIIQKSPKIPHRPVF